MRNADREVSVLGVMNLVRQSFVIAMDDPENAARSREGSLYVLWRSLLA